jgi:hypothetical protein
MKNITVIVILLLTQLLSAQENASSSFKLTKLTPEQKVDRAVMNSVSYMMMGISFAKSCGKTPQDFAVYSAGLALPAWQFLKGKNPVEALDAINRVQQSDSNYLLEITESSASQLTGRMRLYGLAIIQMSRDFGGVTVDDCYTFFNTFVQIFYSHIGFKYEYQVTDDWIVFKLSKSE